MDFLTSYKLLENLGISFPLLLSLFFSLMEQQNKPRVTETFSSEYDYVIGGAGATGSVLANRLSEEKCVSVLLLEDWMEQQNKPRVTETFSSEYDYVIVGAGAAGSVLANRLSEEKCVSILLLEAGGQPPRFTDVPGFFPYFIGSSVDWSYKTVPQDHAGQGKAGNQVNWPLGKVLGGSTTINAMIAIRGSRDNYNDWEASGSTGWGWNDVYPYFLKLEDNTDQEYLDDGYHNVGGPVTMERPRYPSKTKDFILQAVKESGFSMTDSNGARMTGFHDLQLSTRRGQRCSAAKAYLVPASLRENLDILANAFVTKILLEGKRATGVVFEWRNQTRTVRARREVILSAGTVNSAQLLMLSGIGPKEQLDQLGIPVAKDLPVGLNLQDHSRVPVFYVLNTTLPSITDDATRLYIYNRTGYLATLSGIDLLGFLNTKTDSKDIDRPNIELYFYPTTTKVMKSIFGVTDEVYNRFFAQYKNSSIYVCASTLAQPLSRGWVRLRSKDPFDPPLINPKYFDNPDDVEDMVNGMKTCDRIMSSPSMHKLGVTPFANVFSGGCEGLEGDESLQCRTRIAMTVSHPVGTAKMGDSNDPTTVVDTKLRVKGIEGLRVVDASIMPIVPSGNTMIPVYMVAEKASDIIKEDIRCE